MTDPSLLRETLVLEAPQETEDGQGGVVRVFVTAATLKARIEPQGGDTRDREGRITQVNRLRVTVRAFPGLTAANRFRQGERLFRILAIQNADRLGRYLICQCEEETP